MASTETQPDAQAKQQETPVGASSEASNAVPRENMIETAIRFLQNPQVRTSSLAQKKTFLQKKGLTAQEIEIAIDRSGTRQDVASPVAPVQTPANQAMVPAQGVQMQQQMVPYGQPVPSGFSRWRDYMAVAVIVGGVGYGIYKLIQNFLMPFLKSRQEERERLERLEASIQELNKSVLKTVEQVETAVTSIQGLLEQQQAKLDSLTTSVVTNRTIDSHSVKTSEIAEVKSEITSLKGLLLNRHQFPATPQPSPIPSWQRVSPATDSTPTKPRDTQPLPTADPQLTETKTASTDTHNASEVGVANGDSGDVNHSESLVNGDETLDVNINATPAEGDIAPGIASQMEVAQTS